MQKFNTTKNDISIKIDCGGTKKIMTKRDIQDTSDMIIGNIWKHWLF